MSSSPEPPIFILEGHDVGIFDSLGQAQNQLEPVDVEAGIYQGFDAHGRRLGISTDGTAIFIEIVELEPTDFSSLENELRAHLLRLGERDAGEADCDLPCLVEISERHAELSRNSIAGAARELQERYQASFEERGGRLRVSSSTVSDFRTRTKSIELNAGLEWEASRIYDHAHVEVARRRWFSPQWKRVRSLREAVDEIDSKLAEWLRKGL
jgi:hypothetical protein